MRFLRKGVKLFRIINIGGLAWLRVLHRGVAPAVEHIAVLGQVAPLGTIVDIGANRGQFALACRAVFPNVRIISFEPLPGPAAVYRSIFADDPSTRLIQAAVGPRDGETEIHVSRRDDSSSLLPITDTQNRMFPGTGEAGTLQIQVTRLSSCIGDKDLITPALLKLDVQGYELQALTGCESLLSAFDWIYAECSFLELYSGQALADEVIAWLRERGFRLYGVFNLTYGSQAKAIQGDFLFSKNV